MQNRRSTFKIHFFVKRDKQKANGKIPLFCRITINCKEARFGMKVDVSSDMWNAQEGRATGRGAEAAEINTLIDKTKGALFNIYNDIKLSDIDVTAEKVKNRFIGVSAESYTVLTVFQQHNDDLKKLIGLSKSEATYQKYERAKKHFSNFLKARYKASDISFNELNHTMITDFDVYLQTECGCNQNTAAKFIQSFKKIVIIARNNDWLRTDPFANYRISIKKVDRGYLTEDEIQRIMKKKFRTKRLDQVRDIFIFCCFCGLAYIDVKKLREENICKSFDGKLWIMGKREKTDVSYRVPLMDVAHKILKKYENKQPNGRLLPVLSNQKMNAYLKEIGDLCEINKEITFHIARHNANSNQLRISVL